MMKMKGKALTVIAAAIILAGCAGGNKNALTPMPTDSNPSKALQFARAMNLRLISDTEKGQYVIFNEDTGRSIAPLKTPVVVGEKGEAKSGNNGSSDVIAGFITHTAFIPALSVLTSRAPIPFSDGLVRVTTWNGLDNRQNALKMAAVLKKNLPSFTGFGSSKYCQSGYTSVVNLDKNVNANGSLSVYDASALPRPPISEKGTAQIFGFTECFTQLALKKSNILKISQMSNELGNDWAIFLPASTEHEPLIFNAGTALEFIK